LLHMAVGIIAYFWGITLRNLLIAHIAFEYIENTPTGMTFINHNMANIWPGGKNYPDSFINSVGDNVSSIIGWIIAYMLDHYGSSHNWFHKHMKN